MRHHSILLDTLAVSSAIITIFLNLLFPEFAISIRYYVLVIAIISVGISHGAIDHIISSALFNLSYSFRDQIYFYFYYFAMMLIMIFFWLISPPIALLLFLAISIYHFGEADLEYLNLSKKIKYPLYISRGCMIFGLIIFAHIHYTSPIVQEITGYSLLDNSFFVNYNIKIALLSASQYLLLEGIVLYLNWFRLNISFWYKIIDSLLVAILFYVVDPILSFAIYFALWHSLGHIQKMINFLNKKGQGMNIKKFTLSALPFTIITFIGLFILYGFNQAFGIEEEMVSLFFILISVITLPHVPVAHKMLETN